MPYQEVKKPAFYLPILDYMNGTGGLWNPSDSIDTNYYYSFRNADLRSMHLLNPEKINMIHDWGGDNNSGVNWDIFLRSGEHDSTQLSWSEIKSNNENYIYVFILGHNFNQYNDGSQIKFNLQMTENDREDASVVWEDADEIVEVYNYDASNKLSSLHGVSVFKAKFDSLTAIKGFRYQFICNVPPSQTNATLLKIGSISLCTKYTPPHNPDLSLTMSKQFDGISKTTTRGGKTLSNKQFDGVPMWATAPSWVSTEYDLFNPNNGYEHVGDYKKRRTMGRRNWVMNFSYLSNAQLMPEYETIYESIHYANDDIMRSDSFISKFINRTQASHIPFIFQPDSSNDAIDTFSICRLNQEEVAFIQTAPSMYSCELNIQETW